MTCIVFVHGTGVRRPALDLTVAKLTRGMAGMLPDVGLKICDWGTTEGAAFRHDGLSIPAPKSGRGPDESPADDEVMSWATLDADPLFELGWLAAAADEGELPPGAPPAIAEVSRGVLRMTGDERVRLCVAAADLTTVFAEGVAAVMASEPALLAIRQADGAALNLALARAFVATSLRLLDQRLESTVGVPADARDDLVQAVANCLGPAERGRLSDLAGGGLRIAWSMTGARPVERRRRALTEAAGPLAGDILKYLANGAKMRALVAESVRAASGPVLLVGHSLGGVISMEALCEHDLPEVTALVTVGSQCAFLYELDALPIFTIDQLNRLPSRWLNIFDPRDLLSFVAAPIFGDRVTDLQIDNKCPFPRSHSAYFDNKGFYVVLAATVADVGGAGR